uniref:SWIB domain-containing protein n=1 Tax=Macrostomum lignano TaxID=282301 RepID=A0A1I8HEU5_9PLAT
AYNTQFFTSQPDQVVIAVENDFDSAVAHVTACLTNFVSRENPVLRKRTAPKPRLVLQQPAAAIPVVSREAPVQLKTASKLNLITKKKQTKKVKKSKGAVFDEAQMDLEMLQSEYQEGDQLQEPAVLQKPKQAYALQPKWSRAGLPLLNRGGAFLSRQPLKQTPLCGFSVQSASRSSFSAGIGKISAKFFDNPQLAQLQEQLEQSAGHADLQLRQARWRQTKTQSIPIAAAAEFQFAVEISDPIDSKDACHVSVFVNQDLLQDFQVRTSALFGDASELTHGFVSWAAADVSEKMGFCQIDKALTNEDIKKHLDQLKMTGDVEVSDEGAHRTRFRILCRKIDHQRGGADRLRSAVQDAMKANAAALEAASLAAAESASRTQGFEAERRAAESLVAAERVQRFLRTRFDQELDIFDAEADGGGGEGGLRDLRQALIETAVAAFSALAPAASAHAATTEVVVAACRKLASKEAGGRLVSVDQLAGNTEIDRTFLTHDLDWLHQRGIIIYLKRLRIVVADPPWFFTLLESLPFEPPLFAGPLLPGLSPGAGVWSQLGLD